MRRFLCGVPLSLLVCLVGASFGGCKDEPRVDVQPVPASAMTPTRPDQGKVCREVCQRAATCGTENLAKTIKGDPTEVALVNKVRARENETRTRCEATCAADPAATGIEATSACLSQESCETFTGCIEKAGAN